MRLEDPATICTLCLLVPRDKCTALGDEQSLRRVLPQLQPVFDDASLATRVLVVGERAPLQRVPAQTEDRVLPPAQWERAMTPVNQVLVLVQMRRVAGGREPVCFGTVRGALPQPAVSDVEILRVEYVLAPATKQQAAERAARKALRQVAEAMQLPEPPPHQLQQVQVAHGSVTGLLGVPRPQACQWLRGSGCGGVYLRPFWTERTGADVARSKFTLLWARGQGERGPELWKAFSNKPGVFGLLAGGKDVALRVSAEADVAALQAQLGVTLGNTKAAFRGPQSGQRWWRLGPLTHAEVWWVDDLIKQTGLEVRKERGAVRVAAAGPFRKYAYFMATGNPDRTSFDDGSWTSSGAQLSPAAPPPQRRVGSGTLPPQSTWAGPRQPQPSPGPPRPAAPPPGAWLTGHPAAHPSPQFPGNPAAPRSSLLPASAMATFPPLPAPGAGRDRGRQRGDRGRTGGLGSAPSTRSGAAGDGSLAAQVALMASQMAMLVEQVKELRAENALLRQQLDVARGLQSHQPYALQRAPSPQRRPTPPRGPPEDRRRPAAELSPPSAYDPEGAHGDAVMRSPDDAVEAKKTRRMLELDLAASAGVPPGAAAGSTSGSMTSAATLRDDA
jgi:hypothetical protein